VRVAGKGARVCGVAYGHAMQLAAEDPCVTTSGHLALAAALQLEALDFVEYATSPALPGATLIPAASVRAAGKALVAPPATGAADDLPLALELGALPSTLPPVDDLDRTSAAQVAVIVDESSAALLADGTPMPRALLAEPMAQLRRLGAPTDVWLLDDLLAGRVPPYRLYVFLDLLWAEDATVERVLAHLPAEGATALWIAAPGMVGRTFDGRSVRALTGIVAAPSGTAGPLLTTLTRPVKPYTSRLRLPLTYGVKAPVTPRLEVLDHAVQVLGRDAGGRASLVVGRPGGVRAVLSTAPGLPAALLRSLARAAGVPVVSDRGNRLYLTRGLAAVCGDRAGRDLLRLDHARKVTDLAGANVPGELLTTVDVNVEPGRARVFRLGG
jgi:hypothetical protein